MKRKRNHRRFERLLVVHATAAAVDRIATPDKRLLATARRAVQRRLQWHGGMTKREAEAVVHAMPLHELLAALPWWRRLSLTTTTRIKAWTTRR